MLKRIGCALLICLAVTTASADYALKIIPLRHRSAAELIPLIQPMLAPGENVGGVNYQLFLRASDQGVRNVEALLAELDRKRRNLSIAVQQDVAGSVVRETQSLSGSGRAGDARIVLPRPESGGQGVIIGGARPDSLRYQAGQSADSSRNASSQFVRVLEGSPAFIQIGQSLPYVERFIGYAGNRIIATQGTQFLNVTTGFEVLTRLNGERVELEIAPRLSFAGNHGIQDVRFHELRTTVSANLGEWVELGGSNSAHDEVSRAILETGSNRSGETVTIRLKVEEAR